MAKPMDLSEMIAGANDGDANVILDLQIGIVTADADPEGRDRVQIEIPALFEGGATTDPLCIRFPGGVRVCANVGLEYGTWGQLVGRTAAGPLIACPSSLVDVNATRCAWRSPRRGRRARAHPAPPRTHPAPPRPHPTPPRPHPAPLRPHPEPLVGPGATHRVETSRRRGPLRAP